MARRTNTSPRVPGSGAASGEVGRGASLGMGFRAHKGDTLAAGK